PASALAALAVLALSALHANLAYYAAPGDDIVSYSGPTLIPVTVTGRIVAPPQTDGPERLKHTRFLLEAQSVHTPRGPEPVSGILRVGVRGGQEQLAPADRVELIGWLGRVRPPDNPGQYDWAAAARTNDTLATLDVRGAESVRVLPEDAGLIGRLLWRWRMATRSHLNVGDPESNRLLTALIIGERHPALKQLNRAMMRAGTVHILSISGAHLAIFLGFVYLLCRAVALTPRRGAAVALSVLAAYMLLAEVQPALLRSAVMAACLLLGVILRRRHNGLNSLAAAAILILALDPMQLFDVGFQLSFAMVAGLLVLSGPIRQAIFGRWRRRRGLVVFRGEDRLRKWWAFTAVDWFHNAVAMSLAASLASVPLVAFHFGLLSPWAPLLSLALAPLVTAILVPSYLALALAWPMPNASAALASVSTRLSDLFMHVCQSFEHLPGLCFTLRPVDGWWLAACYLTIALWLFRRRIPFGSVFAACGFALVLFYGAYTQRPAPRSGVLELHLLAVGGGQTALLRTSEGGTFLVDAGASVRRSDGADLIESFRRAGRLSAPSVAFISHPNADHYTALPAPPPGRVYVNDYFDDKGPSDEAAQWLADLHGRAQVLRLRAGESLQVDPSTRVEVLWPPADKPAGLTDNDTSLVLRVTCDGRSILFPGDLAEKGQAALAAQSDRVRSDVLVMPHHGHWSKTLPAFVAAVAPKLVLMSSGADPHGPASSREAVEFYKHLSSRYRCYATHRDGWIHLRLDGPLSVETMR
ncbi:MAG: ComEC/Rec2 family competence protein, partial [Planctomycetota bacterium]|nr:ComEC/Rec2 family competence protein [Planctomycetota bacterium]